MSKFILIVTIIFAFISCEQQVSRIEYDALYNQYSQKCEDIQYLRTECENLEDNIEKLESKVSSIEYSKSLLKSKISSAIDIVEDCVEHFEDFEDNYDKYQYNKGWNLIEEVRDRVNTCILVL